MGERRVALVTGAAGGIGAAVAVALSDAGMSVARTDLAGDGLTATGCQWRRSTVPAGLPGPTRSTGAV